LLVFLLKSLKISYSSSFSSIFKISRTSFFIDLISSSFSQSVIQRLILSNYGFKLRTNPAMISEFCPTCSPITARTKSSHHLLVKFFFAFIVIRQPLTNAGSSHAGLIPY
jgi:hypothetical protein